jgi:hypothetical protein
MLGCRDTRSRTFTATDKDATHDNPAQPRPLRRQLLRRRIGQRGLRRPQGRRRHRPAGGVRLGDEPRCGRPGRRAVRGGRDHRRRCGSRGRRGTGGGALRSSAARRDCRGGRDRRTAGPPDQEARGEGARGGAGGVPPAELVRRGGRRRRRLPRPRRSVSDQGGKRISKAIDSGDYEQLEKALAKSDDQVSKAVEG